MATGKSTSVREFVEICFKVLDIPIEWKGKRGSRDEIGINRLTKEVLVKIDPKYFRPSEVEFLQGDPSRPKDYWGGKLKPRLRNLRGLWWNRILNALLKCKELKMNH